MNGQIQPYPRNPKAFHPQTLIKACAPGPDSLPAPGHDFLMWPLKVCQVLPPGHGSEKPVSVCLAVLCWPMDHCPVPYALLHKCQVHKVITCIQFIEYARKSLIYQISYCQILLLKMIVILLHDSILSSIYAGKAIINFSTVYIYFHAWSSLWR